VVNIGLRQSVVRVGEAPAPGAPRPIWKISGPPVTPTGRKAALVAAAAGAGVICAAAVLTVALAAQPALGGSVGVAGPAPLVGGVLLVAVMVWAAGVTALLAGVRVSSRLTRASCALAGASSVVVCAAMVLTGALGGW
jgi:hypothetical protein